ncbi:Htur_1727 family rSAM-partnered candidate RiPP [Natronomonas sp. LN261]|jgi:rSAM-partnered protein|uniref:Htur_1727 family rSAM-partnered candidate RiPP n=1 Tax=Natronomonas sp. LN261 TaxID=2750669 RepID=UPI0015EF48C6|nr:Htur_1727 family rSAM-partnered candidate RiPP [Natronomonas sp. LN261]
MAESTRRRLDSDDRAPHGSEFEVFVRSDGDDPMRHVGSVRADDADGAYELASRLFAWHANDVWICPSGDVARYTTHELADEASTVDRPVDGEEPRNREWS